MKSALTTIFLLILSMCSALGSQDLPSDTSRNSDFKQLIGGWYGEVEGRSVFINLDSNGIFRIELDGGNKDLYFVIKGFTRERLIIKELVQGRRYVSGLDVSGMSEGEARKVVDDLYSHELDYSLNEDSLSFSVADEILLLLRRCKEVACREVKPDNMRLSGWAFDFEVVRVAGSGWSPVKEDKNEFLTLAKPVREFSADSSIIVYTPLAPHLRADDLEYLHTAASEGAFNLLLDENTKLSEAAAFFHNYSSAFPETKFYVVGIDQSGETVRRLIKLAEFKDSDTDVSTWASID